MPVATMVQGIVNAQDAMSVTEPAAVLLQRAHPYFFSGSPPFNFFFAFAFFLPLRSLFFNAVVPAFMTSAYFVKKPSNSSGWTMVDSFILSLRYSFDLPLEARMRTGSGDEGARSGKGTAGSVVEGEEVGGDSVSTKAVYLETIPNFGGSGSGYGA